MSFATFQERNRRTRRKSKNEKRANRKNQLDLFYLIRASNKRCNFLED